jgi:transcriptional regulator with XRE-family HTH domain
MAKTAEKISNTMLRFRAALRLWSQVHKETQGALASRLGVTQAYISQLLSTKGCSPVKMEEICAAIVVDLLDFLAIGRTLRREGYMTSTTFKSLAHIIDPYLFATNAPHADTKTFIQDLFTGLSSDPESDFKAFFALYKMTDPLTVDPTLPPGDPQSEALGLITRPPEWLIDLLPAFSDLDDLEQEAITATLVAFRRNITKKSR